MNDIIRVRYEDNVMIKMSCLCGTVILLHVCGGSCYWHIILKSSNILYSLTLKLIMYSTVVLIANRVNYTSTECPRSLIHLYLVSILLKMHKTSQTYSKTNWQQIEHIIAHIFYISVAFALIVQKSMKKEEVF